MPYLHCFLCNDFLEQRVSDKGKPYFVCDPCGVQIFVRKKTGIERLQNIVSQDQSHGGDKIAKQPDDVEKNAMQDLVDKRQQVQQDLSEIPEPSLFGILPDEHRERRAKLQAQLARLNTLIQRAGK